MTGKKKEDKNKKKKMVETNATIISSLESLLDSYKQQKQSFENLGLTGMAVTMGAHIKMTDQVMMYLQGIVSDLEKSTG